MSRRRKHPRSIDLKPPGRDWSEFENELAKLPDYDRDLMKMTDEELVRYGKHLAGEVERGNKMWELRLAAARAEWVRRHPMKRRE